MPKKWRDSDEAVGQSNLGKKIILVGEPYTNEKIKWLFGFVIQPTLLFSNVFEGKRHVDVYYLHKRGMLMTEAHLQR